MKRIFTVCMAAMLCGTASNPLIAQAITSPEEHLGRAPGTDFHLADWEEVSSWYEKIATESPRVITGSVGKSSEGRDMLLTIVSSEENMARLDEWKNYAAIIADPRGHSEEEKKAAVEEGRLILFISPQMHSNEAAGAESAMQFTWLLANSDEEPWVMARENLVIGVFASTNPDGIDKVSHWYRERVGTPYEAAGMLELYQNYTGHDNNRDWFMLTQPETRAVTEQLYGVWRPQVYWDIHQQGGNSERFFVPPYRDPLNPNIDPSIVAGIDAIGSRALMDMTNDGYTGISTSVTYDMWWNGGNRSVPARHNIMGFLTEAASAELASPVFWEFGDLKSPGDLPDYAPSNNFIAPWPGGWWHIGDIVDYNLAFGESLVGSLSRERQLWLNNALKAAERGVAIAGEEGRRAWIIPSDNRDPGAVRRLVDSLLLSGIEIHVANSEISADGRSYPKGSLVLLTDQPYSPYLNDLFEIQRYPKGSPPYDVSGWTLPLLMGVRRVEAMEMQDMKMSPVTTAEQAVSEFAGIVSDKDGTIGHSAQSDTWTKVSAVLSEGKSVYLRSNGFIAEGDGAEDHGTGMQIVATPRIGLYAPWSGSIDEGWMRWVLDEWEIPYITVRNEQLRAGNLDDFLDVLLIPSVSGSSLDRGRSIGTVPRIFSEGLAPEGAGAIEEFVRTGGRLVTFDNASDWAIDLLQLPVVNVLNESGAKDFSCPGSVLRAIPNPDQTFCAGLPTSMAVFFSRSGAFKEMSSDERGKKRRAKMPVESLLSYAPSGVLLSGWIRKPETIEGRDAWVHVSYGKGEVHLFGIRPQYRGWSQGTFPLIFRALFFEMP